MTAIDEQTINAYKAQNILNLVKHHKRTCDGEKCDINTFLLLEVFERFLGRKATKKEFSVFM